MFKPREVPESGHGGPPAEAAALTHALIHSPEPETAWPARIIALRDDWLYRLQSYDLAPDLAEDIGSRRWFRGLGTMLGLALCALSFWPDFTAITAPPAMPLDARQRDEFRSQTIAPLALGGDSGARMGLSALVVPLQSAPERALVQVTATLGQGDSFAHVLQRAGVSAGDAARVEGMVAGVVPLGDLLPGTQVDITLGRRDAAAQGRPLERIAFRARFDLNLAIERAPGGFVMKPRPIAVDTTPLRIRGTVGTSLYRSARAAGAPIEAIQQYLQVLDQHLSLDSAVEPGDTFDMVVAYKRSGSGEAQVGELLYAGVERGGRAQAQLLRWGSDGQFFEASGMGAQRTGLIMPVVGRITSSYGARRHPILGYTRMHAGIDFGAAYGSPIYAVGDGVVALAGWHGGHGNYVRLEHGGGFATGYAHMSRIAVGAGGRVRAGQVIGYVGSTGLSTGPHLHYELYRGGATVNPLSVRFTVNNQVDQKELAAFKARLATLKSVQPGAALVSLAPRQATIAMASGREIDKLGSD
ncbi:M23 family metallopeptidase [Novosphingobium sp.]|uniref:M23 family metallopeptidase n=1 Tax=Novosphingobium sp. TaxID=1874826 RepID=UPI0035B24CD4